MKKMFLMMSLILASIAPAQSAFSIEVIENEAYIVAPQAPPTSVLEMIPNSPAPGWVWRPGHWGWQFGKWVWLKGHWANPPHPAAEWIPGHWISRPHGWVWIGGHWR